MAPHSMAFDALPYSTQRAVVRRLDPRTKISSPQAQSKTALKSISVLSPVLGPSTSPSSSERTLPSSNMKRSIAGVDQVATPVVKKVAQQTVGPVSVVCQASAQVEPKDSSVTLTDSGALLSHALGSTLPRTRERPPPSSADLSRMQKKLDSHLDRIFELEAESKQMVKSHEAELVAKDDDLYVATNLLAAEHEIDLRGLRREHQYEMEEAARKHEVTIGGLESKHGEEKQRLKEIIDQKTRIKCELMDKMDESGKLMHTRRL